MSQKKKPVTVADLAKSAGAKPSAKKAPRRREEAPASAREAYKFVSQKPAEKTAGAKREKRAPRKERPKAEGLCRIPLVRRARQAAAVAKEALTAAQEAGWKLGQELRDRILQKLTERYA